MGMTTTQRRCTNELGREKDRFPRAIAAHQTKMKSNKNKKPRGDQRRCKPGVEKLTEKLSYKLKRKSSNMVNDNEL